MFIDVNDKQELNNGRVVFNPSIFHYLLLAILKNYYSLIQREPILCS